MPDEPELCCGAEICCNKEKARRALANLIKRAVSSLSDQEAVAVAGAIRDDFVLVPRSLNLDDFLTRFAAMAREHPYT